MSLIPERYRPYLAGLLGTVATGFGHLYLRRWLRGLGWVALAFAVTMAFVPEQTMESITVGETVAEGTALYPTMAVQLAGAFDAFLLAYRENTAVDPDIDVPVLSADESVVTCPNCGKEVDADLDFCHWCTTEFAAPESDSN